MEKLSIRYRPLFFFAVLLAAASGYSQNSLDIYTTSVRQSRIADRMAGMERFLAASPTSGLRQDALEFLVWDSLESGQREQSRASAAELRQLDPQNALALAIISESLSETANGNRKAILQGFDLAKAGIQSYPKLRHPEGMSEGEFIQLQREVVCILDGETGLGFLALKDYRNARTYLRQSIAIKPQDPRYLYGMSLALLEEHNPSSQQEGYLYLARVVNLTRGSAAGQQIADFAQHRFEEAGGTAAGWNDYLASAVIPGTPGQPAAAHTVVASTPAASQPRPQTTATVATTTAAPKPQAATTPITSAASTPTKAATVATAQPPVAASQNNAQQPWAKTASGSHATQPTTSAANTTTATQTAKAASPITTAPTKAAPTIWPARSAGSTTATASSQPPSRTPAATTSAAAPSASTQRATTSAPAISTPATTQTAKAAPTPTTQTANAAPAPATQTAKAASSTATQTANAAPAPATTPAVTAPAPQPSVPAVNAGNVASKAQQSPTLMAKATPPSTPQYDATPPESIPEPTFKREFVSRNAPVSMGILLQTEHLTKENRKEILDALTDMVRHLRNDDEVFIMAYGKKLNFEQDLTGNPRLLEEAMDQIRPDPGTALLDAVGFAAGHLERIATNKNRLLLVISDGRNTPSKDNPLTLSQKLNTVRVDCIGLEVGGDLARRQLESLAAYSGGQVTFANTTSQLRNAAVQMAEGIGIEFPN